MSGDPDPGHAMPPTPEGWTMVPANRPGIVMPSYVRAADGALVRFNATVCAWSAFTAAGERFAGSGLSFTPTGMMQQIDHLAPVLSTRRHQSATGCDMERNAMIWTWVCKFCGWANDNNPGPCRKCGKAP